MAKIAVLGHGVVGSGVLEVCIKNAESIAKKAKEEIDVKYILDLRDFEGLSYSHKFTKDFNVILNDPEVSIVVEVMGGINPAYNFVKSCLLQGKSVVTSNKELVAVKGAELIAIAQDKNVNFLFEASVGGGIPIIRPISQCLAANEVVEIAGILNGTTNFILTKMVKEQMDFDVALKLAQELGYAEKDPTADIEGDDACRKICILAALAFGTHVYPEDVYTQGITKLTLADTEYAENWGGAIKLIGYVKKVEEQIQIMVCPMLVKYDCQLSHIEDVFNGIMVKGDATGDVLFYGKGAGKLPTASAVVGDVIDCVKHFKARKYLFWEDSKENYVADFKKANFDYYVRVSGVNASELVAKTFGEVKALNRANADENEFAFVASNLNQNIIDEKVQKLNSLGVETLGLIRISDL